MSLASSILSGLLFASALVLFLTGLRKGRLKAELNRQPLQDFQAKEYFAALLLCLGSLALHTALVSGIRLASGLNVRLADTFKLYSGLDSKHYFDIARSGYSVTNGAGEILDLVFFPGYPVLTGILMMALPEMLSGYLAAWIPFLIAGMTLYRLFRLDYDRRKSLRILLWMCLLPGAVFYSYPMSESLFLAAAAGAVYTARTRRWFAAGVCGFLAAFTRSTGLLLLVPLGIELLEQYAGRYRKDAVCRLPVHQLRGGRGSPEVPAVPEEQLAPGGGMVFPDRRHPDGLRGPDMDGEPDQILGAVGPEPGCGFCLPAADAAQGPEPAGFGRRLVFRVLRGVLRRQLAAERTPVHGGVLAGSDSDRGNPDSESGESRGAACRGGGLHDLFRHAVEHLVRHEKRRQTGRLGIVFPGTVCYNHTYNGNGVWRR